MFFCQAEQLFLSAVYSIKVSLCLFSPVHPSIPERIPFLIVCVWMKLGARWTGGSEHRSVPIVWSLVVLQSMPKGAGSCQHQGGGGKILETGEQLTGST